MASSRRKFLKYAAVGSAASFGSNHIFASIGKKVKIKKDNPVVVSTWDFGKTANVGAWEILGKGGRALDAVEAGVRIPEADPTNQTIGYGGLPDRDGNVTLDACIMDEKYNCGSVMCLEYIMHPISVARLVMEKNASYYFKRVKVRCNLHLPTVLKKQNLLTPESEKAWKEWMKSANYSPEMNIENKLFEKGKDPMPGGPNNHDTIGMMAMDANGDLSGACTTSGLAYKMHGRVGDSPVIGAGLYVDNEIGAATSSGVGEEVIRIVGSHLVVELMRHGMSPEMACKEAVNRIVLRSPEKSKTIQVGFVALNKQGEYGGYSLQPGFSFSVKSNSVEQVFKSKEPLLIFKIDLFKI